MVGFVRGTTVQGIGVKEQRVALLHFTVDQLQSLFCMFDTLRIRAGLVASQDVVDTPHLVRST